jgi:prepilin-type N-terminal cleavage/methylation domain-containing protein
MCKCSGRARRVHLIGIGKRPSGFSLLELAITLAVVTLLLGGLLVPLSTQIAQRNEAATQRQLEDIREALLGFAAANGRLPCPATGTTGAESFNTTTGGDPTNGDCGTATGGAFIGFLPATTLGLNQVDSSGFAVDAWGANPHNRIRYAVSSDMLNGQTFPFTKAGGMRAATMSWVASAELLHVCASGTGPALGGTPTGWHCAAGGLDTTNTLTFNAPVVIWSAGANGASGGTSADEIQNPNPVNPSASLDRIFVSRSRSSNPEFDDIVTWMSSGRLVNRMIVAGQLP